MYLMWEVSTPCVYLRWLLAHLGRNNTKLYVANGLAMLGTFFVARNLLGLRAPPPGRAVHAAAPCLHLPGPRPLRLSGSLICARTGRLGGWCCAPWHGIASATPESLRRQAGVRPLMRPMRAVMSINFFRDTGRELRQPWHSSGGMSHGMLYTYRVRSARRRFGRQLLAPDSCCSSREHAAGVARLRAARSDDDSWRQVKPC